MTLSFCRELRNTDNNMDAHGSDVIVSYSMLHGGQSSHSGSEPSLSVGQPSVQLRDRLILSLNSVLTASDEVGIVCLWSLKGSSLSPVTQALCTQISDQRDEVVQWSWQVQSTNKCPNPAVVTENNKRITIIPGIVLSVLSSFYF